MYGRCSRSPDSLWLEKKGYGEVIHFPLEFETLLALQAVHVEVATKASDQNVEIVGKNGPQILTFSRSLQTGKMAPLSRNGGRQTANAENVRSRDHLCRSWGKNTRCLISLMSEWEGRTGKYLARGQGVRTERSGRSSCFWPTMNSLMPSKKRRFALRLFAYFRG